MEEYDGSDVWQARYVYEDGIDHPRAMDRRDIADIDGDADLVEIQRFHYHQNALSSTAELTGPGGAVQEWVNYDAYGKATVRDALGAAIGASAVGNPFLFTGREWDAESGLFFYRARAYDPVAGRFLQRDPLGYVDGMGLHEYVGSSAASRIDPMGLEGEPKKRPTLKLDGGSGKEGAAKLARLKDAAHKLASIAGKTADINDAKEGNVATVTFKDSEKSSDTLTSPTAASTLEHLEQVAQEHGPVQAGMPDKMPPHGKPWGDGKADETKGNSQYGVTNECALNPHKKYKGWELAWTLLHELLHIWVYHEAYDKAYAAAVMAEQTPAEFRDKVITAEVHDKADAHADDVARDLARDDVYDGDVPVHRPTWERTFKAQKEAGNKDFKKGPAKKKTGN